MFAPMARRRLSLTLLLYAWLGAALLPAAPAALAKRPELTFFSSLSEQALARLSADAVSPRFARHGPFRIPAPGLVIEAPVLSLHDEPCTAEDWSRFLTEFAAWRALPAKARLHLVAPDGRVFAFLDAPTTAHGILSGLVYPLSAPDPEDDDGSAPASSATRLLRIRHDGAERLVLHLTPVAATTAPVPSAQ